MTITNTYGLCEFLTKRGQCARIIPPALSRTNKWALMVQSQEVEQDRKLHLFSPAASPGGASIPVASRVSTELYDTITRLVEHPNSPWDTKAEFMRDALDNFIDFVAGVVSDGTAIPQIIMLVRVLRDRSEQSTTLRKLSRSVYDTLEELEIYYRDRDLAKLAIRMEETAETIQAIEDYFWFRRAIEGLFSSSITVKIMEALERSNNIGPSAKAIWQTWQNLREEIPSEATAKTE